MTNRLSEALHLMMHIAQYDVTEAGMVKHDDQDHVDDDCDDTNPSVRFCIAILMHCI